MSQTEYFFKNKYCIVMDTNMLCSCELFLGLPIIEQEQIVK